MFKRKRIFSLLLFAAFICLPVVATAEQTKITVLHLNDVYEISPSGSKEKKGGMARLKTLVDSIKKGDPEALFFLSGDFLSPSLMSSVFQGKQMVDLLNHVGLDFASFGNHEFDLKTADLKQGIRDSRFIWVSSNILENGRQYPGTEPFAIKKIREVKVGLFGMLLPETKQLAHVPDNVTFTDIFETATKMVETLKEKNADIIIALTHLDFRDDEKLLEKVPGIDLVLGGHEHTIMSGKVGHSLIVKSGTNARALGKIEISYHKEETPRVSFSFSHIPVDASIEGDRQVSAKVAEYEQKLDEKLNVEIGKTSVELNAMGHTNRTMETGLGSFIADVIAKKVDADIGLQNGGGIRSDKKYGPGTITKKDIFNILPFGSSIVKIKVTGKTLKEALENGVSQHETVAGRFLQVSSGLSFEVSLQNRAGQRVGMVKVQGEPLDPSKKYTVATSNYLYSGGDGFIMLKDAEALIDPLFSSLVADAVIEEIESVKTISPVTEGRIKFVSHGQ